MNNEQLALIYEALGIIKRRRMKFDICPNCNKRGLEKIKTDSFFDKIFGYQNKEWWGCVYCGQAFFKRVKIKEE